MEEEETNAKATNPIVTGRLHVADKVEGRQTSSCVCALAFQAIFYQRLRNYKDNEILSCSANNGDIFTLKKESNVKPKLAKLGNNFFYR